MAKKKLDKKTAEKVSDLLDKGYLRCTAIVEMMGSPKEYLSKTMKNYVERLKQNKKLFIVNAKFAKPKKHETMFTSFVEIEMLVKNAAELVFFCFDGMPSSIEIIEPESIKYDTTEFAGFLNDMVARMHRLDAHIKTIKAKASLLEKNAGLLLRNNVMIVLKDGEKDIEEVGKNVGIPGDQLNPFLEKLISEGWIKKTKDKYSLNIRPKK
ncbi:hypothetical protein ACFL96_07080 [Thermoproteota archaeon]